MVLSILFTDDEIKKFFESNGFEVEEREFGTWGKAYHNTEEYQKRMQLAVIIKGKYVEARKLFERIAEKRMKRYLAPVSMEAKRMIDNEFRNMKNQ